MCISVCEYNCVFTFRMLHLSKLILIYGYSNVCDHQKKCRFLYSLSHNYIQLHQRCSESSITPCNAPPFRWLRIPEYLRMLDYFCDAVRVLPLRDSKASRDQCPSFFVNLMIHSRWHILYSLYCTCHWMYLYLKKKNKKIEKSMRIIRNDCFSLVLVVRESYLTFFSDSSSLQRAFLL